jgi:hypothetical protein
MPVGKPYTRLALQYRLLRRFALDVAAGRGCLTPGCACCADAPLNHEAHCVVGDARVALATIKRIDQQAKRYRR